MTAKISAELKGLKETQRNMEQAVRDLRGTPMLQAMRDSTLYVTRDAKQNLVGYQSPEVGGVDTGRTRASITPEVRSVGETIEGVVGSNLLSALIQEVGSRPHWPPFQAVETWARRHGTTAFIVARAISRHGNIPRHFLSRAFESNKDKIEKRLNQAVEGIIKKSNGQ